MKRAASLFGVGLAALTVQSALAVAIPHPFCPDLGLLVVIAIGLCWESLPSGFALAAVLGYTTDVLSGSLFGQHALLRLLSFAAARLGGRQLNLRGGLPLAVFVAGLTFVYAGALRGVLSFFTGAPGDWSGGIGRALIHALVNAIAAPFVAAGVAWVYAWAGDEEGARRGMRLDAGPAR